MASPYLPALFQPQEEQPPSSHSQLEFLSRIYNERNTHICGNVHKVIQSPTQTHGSAYQTQECIHAQMSWSHILPQSGKEMSGQQSGLGGCKRGHVALPRPKASIPGSGGRQEDVFSVGVW